MNAVKQTIKRIDGSTLLKKSLRDYHNKSPLVKITMNIKCEDEHKRNLEKYMEYRRDCWNKYNRNMNLMRYKSQLATTKDLNDWETQKALQHAFKN